MSGIQLAVVLLLLLTSAWSSLGKNPAPHTAPEVNAGSYYLAAWKEVVCRRRGRYGCHRSRLGTRAPLFSSQKVYKMGYQRNCSLTRWPSWSSRGPRPCNSLAWGEHRQSSRTCWCPHWRLSPRSAGSVSQQWGPLGFVWGRLDILYNCSLLLPRNFGALSQPAPDCRARSNYW